MKARPSSVKKGPSPCKQRLPTLAICLGIVAAIAMFLTFRGSVQPRLQAGLVSAESLPPPEASWSIAALLSGLLFAALLAAFAQAFRSRRQAAKLTRLEHELCTLRQLAENIQEVFWIGSPDWNEVHFISPAYEGIWGRSCADLYRNPRSWLEQVAAEDRDALVAVIDTAGEVFRHSSVLEFPEYRIRRADGSNTWISARAFPIRGENGRVQRIAGIAEDISARRVVEEALNTQNAFLHSVLDSFPYPFYVVDAASYSIVTANPKTATLGPWQGSTCHALSHHRDTPCDAAGELCPLAEIKRTRKPTIVEHVHYDQRGEAYCYELHAAPIFGAQGEVVQMLEYSVDITERKRTQEELRRYRKNLEEQVTERTRELEAAKAAAEAANVAKGEFLAVMSHELRTPVTAILGFAELLEDIPNESAEKRKEYLGYIRDSGDRLRVLISDVLDISGVATEEAELCCSAVDIRNVTERLCGLFGPRMQQHDIRLVAEVEEGIGAILTDERRLKQVLAKLLGNALKFSEPGDTVSVTTRRATTPERVTIAVADTGMGIPRERLNGIFEAFSQVDASYSRKHGGLGLGLAIAKKVTEQLGGEIGAKSEPGKGSTFWITLPMQNLAATVPAPPQGEQRARPSRHILLVEDNAVNLTLTRTMLESFGYRVATARDGHEAVKIHASASFGLILMDCQLPEMDGYEATRQIRAQEEAGGQGNRIPIVALTAHALEGDRERCLAVGMDDYLDKPFTGEQLQAVLDRYLAERTV